MPDEASRLYLRLAYTLDRRSRKKDGTRLVPWDLDPVRLPALNSWVDIEDGCRRLARLTRDLPNGFRKEWLRDHLPTLRSLVAMLQGHVPPLREQVRDLYGLPARPAKEEELDSLRVRIRRILRVSREDEVRRAVE